MADHQFVGCLERTAATETWESRSPDGRRWQVKVLFNVVGRDTKRLDAVQRLESLTHHGLVPARILPGSPGALVIATEFSRASLFDYLKQHQLDGAPGVPRKPLLRWLRRAATTLDEVASRHSVAHLSLSPRQLLPAGEDLLVAECGLAQLMWLPAGQFLGQVKLRYAAPELPDRFRDGPACDQFSLAAIFQELLTGTPPFRARPAGLPDLSSLEETDRQAVARALSFDPKKRFRSCVELIDALENVEVAKNAFVAPVPAPAVPVAAAKVPVAPVEPAAKIEPIPPLSAKLPSLYSTDLNAVSAAHPEKVENAPAVTPPAPAAAEARIPEPPECPAEDLPVPKHSETEISLGEWSEALPTASVPSSQPSVTPAAEEPVPADFEAVAHPHPEMTSAPSPVDNMPTVACRPKTPPREFLLETDEVPRDLGALAPAPEPELPVFSGPEKSAAFPVEENGPPPAVSDRAELAAVPEDVPVVSATEESATSPFDANWSPAASERADLASEPDVVAPAAQKPAAAPFDEHWSPLAVTERTEAAPAPHVPAVPATQEPTASPFDENWSPAAEAPVNEAVQPVHESNIPPLPAVEEPVESLHERRSAPITSVAAELAALVAASANPEDDCVDLGADVPPPEPLPSETAPSSLAAEPAPPVEPSRLLTEGRQPATLVSADSSFTAPTRSSPVDEPPLDGSKTIPLPYFAPFDQSEPVSSTERAEASSEGIDEPVPAKGSPFDPGFQPTGNDAGSDDDWLLNAPSEAGQEEPVGATDGPAVATAEAPPERLSAVAMQPTAEPEVIAESAPSEPVVEPYCVTLRTAKLLPGSDAAIPKIEQPSTESPRPIFRALRSLRKDAEVPKSKAAPATPLSRQTAIRRAANLKALLEAAAQAVPPNEPEQWQTTEAEGEVLECRFPASLPPSGAPINFEKLRDKWNGQIVSVGEDAALLEVGGQKKLWKRLLSRPTPLLVEIRWSRPRPPEIGIPGVTMRVRLANKSDKYGSASLHDLGPKLTAGLRSQLQGGSERRREKRILWVQPVTATFLLSNGDVSGTVDGQSRDISPVGVGLYLPRILPGTQVTLTLNNAGTEPIDVIGKFVRVQRCGDGWYEVGVRFEM